MKKWWHRHWWQLLFKDALGRYEKQPGQGGESVFECRGAIEICACGIGRIVPHDRRLMPVEIFP